MHTTRTTSNYSAVANLHTTQITTEPAKPIPACRVLISRYLVKASSSGESSASRSQNSIFTASSVDLSSQLTTDN
jgi:hypothetical protein